MDNSIKDGTQREAKYPIYC